ncbi:hypothetical protein [Hymenobacter metallicola]|uniref:CD-NTase-associated protein 12/Pycsar effector protein TIR domain-containing protein n=1 Tax=Hymenobacter metallicola TaxID=2563114 RepID=A0A4Z0Q0L0_9BACT|nr:hypothetical protein [Hymenobacter metallicola]TGE23497.1 hypothetical protein E5K02_20125 [Hymenobacter metallicola]
MKENNNSAAEGASNPAAAGKGICGIIMSMSGSEHYTENHWKHIQAIIEDAASEAGFKARIVSVNENQGILQSNIVTNLFHDEIVVCDVSNQNPNVMLELGMRIAFGKPFVVIKDTKTNFASDIRVVIHEQYDKDMLYPEAKAFKARLTELIKAESTAASQPNYKSFLSTFRVKEIEVSEVEVQKVSFAEALAGLIRSVDEMKVDINDLKRGGISEFPQQTLPSLSDEMKGFIKFHIERQKAIKPDEPINLTEVLEFFRKTLSTPERPMSNGLIKEVVRYVLSLGVGDVVWAKPSA